MMRAAALALVMASPAAAQVSSEGHFYDIACNQSGFALTSQYPVGRFFGSGAATQISQDREVIYLGRSCDAARSGWSGGTWCWANGGYVIEFPERRIGFPRQELFCPSGADSYPLVQNCGC